MSQSQILNDQKSAVNEILSASPTENERRLCVIIESLWPTEARGSGLPCPHCGFKMSNASRKCKWCAGTIVKKKKKKEEESGFRGGPNHCRICCQPCITDHVNGDKFDISNFTGHNPACSGVFHNKCVKNWIKVGRWWCPCTDTEPDVNKLRIPWAN